MIPGAGAEAAGGEAWLRGRCCRCGCCGCCDGGDYEGDATQPQRRPLRVEVMVGVGLAVVLAVAVQREVGTWVVALVMNLSIA